MLADISLTPSPGITSPRSLNRGESLSQDGVAWPEVDGLNDADLDDEIEAFERSLRADWEVGFSKPIQYACKQFLRLLSSTGFKDRQALSCI